MSKNDNGKGIAIGAAIGAVAGVITGILFAPKSGKETREDIKNAAEKAGTKLQDEATKLQDEAKSLIAKVENRAKEASGKTADSAKEHAELIKEKATRMATVVKAVKAGEASDKDLNEAVKQFKAARASVQTFLSK